ncbi:S9 family peptidase [Leptolyngbya sp. PCC 6406]|uniref:S9 family peptidase n=1 Tax=Leptolyngbya sp. PCC 6406 TaxID=1173264 RepID=UPI0002AC7BE9|nr:prolyl oligopeptidase family serine peptidase [Leptolyngbya sp. PCC 6406]
MPRLSFPLGPRNRCALSLLLLGVAIALGKSPVAAEIVPVGSYGFYEAGEELPSLNQAEQDRLDILQAAQSPIILSDVSPNGEYLIVSSYNRLSQYGNGPVQLLNLKTGELEESAALSYEVVSPALPIRWVDNTTIRFVQEGFFGPWEIVSINRITGIVSRTTVYPTEAESGQILGAAPDLSGFALQVYGEEEDIIYLVSLGSLGRIEVGRIPTQTDLQPPSWSANGQQVAVLIASTEVRSLYDRTPFSPNLADPVSQDALGRTPPEDNVFLKQSQVKVYDLTQTEPLQMELGVGNGNGDVVAGVAISPDGQRVLVKYHEPGQVVGRAYPTYLFPQRSYYRVFAIDGTPITTIEHPVLDGPLENSGRFVDGDTLIFHATLGTNRHLYLYDLPTGELRSLPLPPGSVDGESWQVTADGRSVFYSFSSVTQPPELFSLALDGNSPPVALTDINRDVASSNRVQVNPVAFQTRNGPREGFLVQPAGAAFPPRQNPIVFWQQGGPGFSMVNEFAVEVEMPYNLLPNFGISVLAVPLAGREGFGPETYRLQADGNNFGQVDILEGVEIAGQLVSQGWTTPRQLGVTGCSYGGYYSAQAISRFPSVFAAANPQCSLLDAFTEWQLGYSALLSYLTGQTPMEAPELYGQISPLYNAHLIRTPTMIFHGSDDFLQVDMARNFHDVIDANGVPVTLYEFEGVGHSIFDISLQRIAAQLQIEFFRHHLTTP